MRKARAIAWLNLKQGLREKLFYGVLFFFASFLAFCALLGELSVGESEKVIRSAGLAGMELSGLILVVFSLIFSFYRERDSRILEIYLTNFSRGQYISGKLIGYLLILLIFLGLAAAGYALILLLYQAFAWQIIAGIYFLFLKLSIVTGFTLFFACLFSSPALALLCSLFSYFAAETAHSALQIILRQGSTLQAVFFKGLYYCLPNMDKLD
ncbi:MAG: hypothetical protein AAB855_02860, partial [Patescibacteria group bacterium]